MHFVLHCRFHLNREVFAGHLSFSVIAPEQFETFTILRVKKLPTLPQTSNRASVKKGLEQRKLRQR
jgi:hypothetical protein